MSDDGDDVDPTNPQPKGRYGQFRDSPWYYVNDELTQTSTLGPATDAEPGDDRILSFTREGVIETDRERVCVRLTPRALYELYVETKDLSPDTRQAGHTAECGLCGESVPLEKAVPNKREEPVHKRRYVDAYDGPVWIEDY